MSQSIQHPFGVTAFGSALLRVAPDLASIRLSVARQHRQADAAFKEARTAAQAVRAFLARAQVEDVQSSRITLEQVWRHTGGQRQADGYTARIGFHVVLHELDRLEEVVSGAVGAGANEVQEVSFQSRRLAELRAEARRKAVHAAREKAELYARAGGVALGRLLHIEDVNPNQLRGYESHVMRSEPEYDDEGPVKAFDPGSITVGAAVIVSFALATEG